MSEQLKDKIALIKNRFKDFSNYLELDSFRSFLLFTLTSKSPSNLLAQLGMGGNKDIIILPYDPVLKIYYQKINLLSAGSLIIYVKSEPISEEFTIKKDDPIIKQYLNANELSLAFHGKEKFLLPRISDCSIHDLTEEEDIITLNIDDLYHSLKSFIATTEPNVLFVLNGNDGREPDVLFSFNLMPQMPMKWDRKELMIDVFLDEEHKTKDMTYLRKEEDFSLVYMKDIKEVSHADLYTSTFSLLLHVRSLKKPY